MTPSFEHVRPREPVAPYLGGKSKLAETVISYINQIPHNTYAEAFVGMGGIFLRRDYRPGAEVINDYSRDISNFFRVLQVHYVAFLDMLKWQITTRAEFERLISTDPNTLTDMQRAARFLYLQRTAFGGKITGRNFGVSKDRPARFDISKLSATLEDVHERLSGVTVERLDYKEFIKRYDQPECLFYLDPPYYQCESDYGKELFCRDEFKLMADIMREVEGKFIISLNDHQDVRDIFKAFHIISVETTYSISSKENQKVGEVLITNAQSFFRSNDLFD